MKHPIFFFLNIMFTNFRDLLSSMVKYSKYFKVIKMLSQNGLKYYTANSQMIDWLKARWTLGYFSIAVLWKILFTEF